jgi:ABC-2 type transport system permease protein
MTAATAAVPSALRLGLTRGWITYRSMVTTREGFFQTVIWNAVPLAALILNRPTKLGDTDLSFSAALLPGVLAIGLAFGVMGTAYNLSTEREDGTLLRSKAVPGGTSSYVVGLCVASALDGLVSLLVVLVPALFIVPVVPLGDPLLWLGLLGYVALGLAAVLPLGILVGSVVRSPRVIGGLGFFATAGLAALSGLFFPVQALWGWVQVLVQAFPVYWLGLGLRSSFLPAEAAALEIGGSWRTFETIAVLGAWSAVGLLLGPVLLRRMARRESGSAVEARRQQAMQRT